MIPINSRLDEMSKRDPIITYRVSLFFRRFACRKNHLLQGVDEIHRFHRRSSLSKRIPFLRVTDLQMMKIRERKVDIHLY